MTAPTDHPTSNRALKDPAKADTKQQRKRPQNQAKPQQHAQAQHQKSQKERTSDNVDSDPHKSKGKAKPKAKAASKASTTKAEDTVSDSDRDSVERMLYPDLYDADGKRIVKKSARNQNQNQNQNQKQASAQPHVQNCYKPKGPAFAGSSFENSPAISSLPRPAFRKPGVPAEALSDSLAKTSLNSPPNAGPLPALASQQYQHQQQPPVVSPPPQHYMPAQGPGAVPQAFYGMYGMPQMQQVPQMMSYPPHMMGMPMQSQYPPAPMMASRGFPQPAPMHPQMQFVGQPAPHR